MSTADQPRDAVLVFDFGTSYFKAGVVDSAGQIVALHRQPSPIVTTAERSEMAPEALYAAVRTACRELRPHLARVAAISFASQANTFTLLDADKRPLMPLIVWNDPRGAAVQDELRAFADDAFTEASGIPSLNHQFTVGRLAWMNRSQGTRLVQWLADRFMWCLTGRHVTEAGLAALSGLFDVPRWTWSESACRVARISPAQLPEVVRAGEPIGEVLPAVAGDLGLPAGCRVVAGCLDQYAGALGVGNDRPGLLSETTGTVLATVACSNQWPAHSPKVFRGPASSQGVYLHMSFGDISANLLEHYRQQLPDKPTFETLCEVVDTNNPLRLDPAADPNALKQTLTDWATTQPRPAVVGAIFRVVAEALAGQVQNVSTTPAADIRSAGGAAKNRTWLQIKADVLGVPVIAPATEEPTLLGAATLAAEAFGWPRLAAIDQPPDASRIFVPRENARNGAKN